MPAKWPNAGDDAINVGRIVADGRDQIEPHTAHACCMHVGKRGVGHIGCQHRHAAMNPT